MNKDQIREKIRKMLHSQSREEIKEKSQTIMNKLLNVKEFKNAETVALYLGKPFEVDTNYTIRHLLKGEKKLAVPVTNSEIKLVEFTSFEDLIMGKFDVYEPRERIFIDYVPKVTVIPGIAFDLCRNRIGHGFGFYDKFLEGKNTYKIGLAFEFQVIEEIKCKKHDIGMDLIITEERVI